MSRIVFFASAILLGGNLVGAERAADRLHSFRSSALGVCAVGESAAGKALVVWIPESGRMVRAEFGGGGRTTALAVSGDCGPGTVIAGRTTSRDLPKATNAPGGGTDGFLVALGANLEPVNSLYIGGAGEDSIVSMAGGLAAGSTDSESLGGFDSHGGTDAIAGAYRLDSSGQVSFRMLYRYGGPGEDRAAAVAAVDRVGEPDAPFEREAVLSGTTTSDELPGASGRNHGGSDVFYVRFRGDAIRAANLIGGSGTDELAGMTADHGSGMLRLLINTDSTDLPGPERAAAGMTPGGRDAAVIRIEEDDSIAYHLRVGGRGDDRAVAISGTTIFGVSPSAQELPLAGPEQSPGRSAEAAFLITFDDGTTSQAVFPVTARIHYAGEPGDLAPSFAADDSHRAVLAGANADAPFVVRLGPGAEGKEAPPERFARSAPERLASATFQGVDNTTQGAWKTLYGGDGYYIPNLATNYPAYATVSHNGTPFTWNSNPTDPEAARALDKPTPPGRFGSAVISSGQFQFDVNLTDGQPHRVALYMTDWQSTTTAQTVAVLDHATNAVLDTQSVSGFRSGRWLIYTLTGHVLIRVTRTAGSWAQINGVFLGGGAAGSITANGGASQSTVINTAFGTALQAVVRNGSSQPLPGVTVTFSAPAAGASASLSSSTAVTDALGAASVTATANGVAGAYLVTATANGSAATFSLTNLVGPANSITATQGTPQAAVVGTAFATNLQATVRDAGNNPIAGATVTFTPPAAGATAALNSPTAVTNALGQASVSATAGAIAGGPYDVIATVAGVGTGAPFSLTNTPNVPASVSATGGTPQSALVTTAFATPLQVTVRNASNNPVSGVTVTFSAPPSGASADLSSSTAVTNAAGVASVNATANATAGGPYNVTATVAGVAVAATFALTNTSNLPASISPNGGTPQSTAVNTAFSAALQVIVRNASNNPVSGATVTFTPPASGAGANLSSLTAVTNASGIASVNATANATAGSYNVNANVAGVASPAVFALTNTAAGGGGGTALFLGADSTTQGAWKAQYGGDGYYIPNLATAYPSYATVAITATPFTWTANPATAADIARALERPTPPGSFASAVIGDTLVQFDMNFTDGLPHRVAFYMTDWQSSTAAQSIQIIDFATNSALDTQPVSAYRSGRWMVYRLTGHVVVRVTRTAGSWAQINGIFFGGSANGSITVTGGGTQSATTGTPFGSALEVTVRDGSNAPIPGAVVTFTAPGSGASATLSSATATTNASGVASVTAVANGTAGSYQVTAGFNGSTVNFALTNLPGPPASIAVLGGSGQAAAINAPFGSALQAVVRDAGNNPVPGVTVAFNAPGSGASASLSSPTAVTNAAGVASVNATANGIAGGPYAVSGSVSGLGGSADFLLTNTPAPPASVSANGGGGQSATVLSAFANALQVLVRDASNQPVSGVLVNFSAPGAGASASLSSPTATTNASGLAGVTATANAIAGAYNVTATVSGVATGATFALTNTAGPPASIAATGGAVQSAVVNTAFGTPLQATVRDAQNNPVSAVLVTFTPPASGASAVLSALTATTNASGVASVNATANATAGGPYNVAATVGGVGGAANFALTNTAVGGSGNSATLLAYESTTQGNWRSQYGADGYFMPNLATSYPAYATVTVTGTPFTWTSNPPPADQQRALEKPVPPGRFASAVIDSQMIQFDVNLTDGQPHRVAFYMTDWSSSTGAQRLDVLDFATSAVLHSQTVGASYRDGKWVVYTLSGHVVVRVTRTAGSWAQINGIFFGGPAAGSVTPVSGTPQSTAVGTAFPLPLRVRVLDGASSPVIGAAVTFTPPASGAGATLSSTTAVTDVDGFASVTATANVTGGSYTVQASYNGTTGAFQLTNTSGPPASVVASGGATQIASINTAFGSPLQVVVRDAGNNPIGGVTVTFAAPGSGASAVLSSNTAVTDGAGLASVTATANGTDGAYVVTASVAGVATSANFNLTNITGSTSPAAVEFVAFDLTTQGWWKWLGRGTDGYSFPTATSTSPFLYGTVAVPQSSVIWYADSGDARAMEKPTGSSRVYAAFTSALAATAAIPAVLEFDLNVNPGRTEQVRLYWSNGDNAARSQTVTILDAQSQAVLYTRAIPDFSNGRWMIWNISGHVIIRITQTTAGQVAVCSGIFFNPKP